LKITDCKLADTFGSTICPKFEISTLQSVITNLQFAWSPRKANAGTTGKAATDVICTPTAGLPRLRRNLGLLGQMRAAKAGGCESKFPAPKTISLFGAAMMSAIAESSVSPFVDRRNYDGGGDAPDRERRQFSNSHEGLSPEARELALAIDHYKLAHRRRFITYEEMLNVVKALGYHK
jgi:hypothetical protein